MLRSIILALAALAMATSIAHAETIVPGGNVSGLWNLAGSPYLIRGNITIPATETLIVEPGVSVIFQGTYRWFIYGWLEAIGTATDSILITAQDTTARWYGIKFDDAPDSSYLEYCLVEYARAQVINTGGAIHCLSSNPVISHCTFRYNLGTGGGAIYLSGSYAQIMYSDFIRNGLETITYWGGAIAIDGHCPTIAYCYFFENRCSNAGGGLCLNKGASALAFNNYFVGNERLGIDADAGGGLNAWDGINLTECVFADNHDSERGGGMIGASLNKTVVYHNLADWAGGGIYTYGNSPLSNSIVWNNLPDQISGNPIQVSYCDIQNGWPGIGNIDSDPLFVAPQYYDFRLQWGSPCIDAGDPNPTNNDPDGTRGDIGPFYYDQSIPVRVLLTPHERNIVIPVQGGNFDYTLWLTNISPVNPTFTVWTNVTLPNGATYGPILGPITAQLGSGQTVNRVRSQTVPAGAPRGLYAYNAYAVAGTDTSRDSFSFFKMEPAQAGGLAGWNSTGETLDNLGDSDLASSLPLSSSLQQNYPNPFNPVTSITFQLPVTGQVSLGVYNLQGRLVAQLVSGQRAAGTHTVTWDATDFASGLYFCKMEAGNYSQVMKMMLVK